MHGSLLQRPDPGKEGCTASTTQCPRGQMLGFKQ